MRLKMSVEPMPGHSVTYPANPHAKRPRKWCVLHDHAWVVWDSEEERQTGIRRIIGTFERYEGASGFRRSLEARADV